jgi:stress-induced-phosphoprotein 1
VVALKPNWVKGHARKAAALMGLQCYGEAKECYQRALKYEPDDAALQKGLDKVGHLGRGS